MKCFFFLLLLRSPLSSYIAAGNAKYSHSLNEKLLWSKLGMWEIRFLWKSLGKCDKVMQRIEYLRLHSSSLYSKCLYIRPGKIIYGLNWEFGWLWRSTLTLLAYRNMASRLTKPIYNITEDLHRHNGFW